MGPSSVDATKRYLSPFGEKGKSQGNMPTFRADMEVREPSARTPLAGRSLHETGSWPGQESWHLFQPLPVVLLAWWKRDGTGFRLAFIAPNTFPSWLLGRGRLSVM